MAGVDGFGSGFGSGMGSGLGVVTLTMGFRSASEKSQSCAQTPAEKQSTHNKHKIFELIRIPPVLIGYIGSGPRPISFKQVSRSETISD